jgi:hypothetical protein
MPPHVTRVIVTVALAASVLLTSSSAGAVSEGPGTIARASTHPGPPTISDNGRYVVFQATRRKTAQVMLRDNRKHTTVVVSARSGKPGNKASVRPSISPDGRYVAYVSSATDLVGDGVGGSGPRVLLWDRRAGTTRVITTPDAVADNYSTPRVSRGAAVVAYVSLTTAPAGSQVAMTPTELVWSRATNATTVLPTPGIDFLSVWSLTEDGRFLAQEGLSVGGATGTGTVLVDRSTGTMQELPTWGPAYISGSGDSVALAGSRLAGDTIERYPAVWDRRTGTTRELRIPPRFRAASSVGSTVLAISTSGRFVVVSTVGRGADGGALLLFDRRAERVTRVDRASASTAAVDSRGATVTYVDEAGALRVWKSHG